MAPPAKKPRGPSAYMVFTDERRQEVQERLKQESDNGKVAAPAIAKALGEVWKGMSEEQKDVYRQKSKERAEAAAAGTLLPAAGAKHVCTRLTVHPCSHNYNWKQAFAVHASSWFQQSRANWVGSK